MPKSQHLNSGFPVSLFAPLASPLADAYTRILADLYAESRRAAVPLSREIVLDIIIHHTAAAQVGDPLPQARETLQYLEECAWLRDEIQPDHSRACALTPHAFQLLQAIHADSPTVLELLIAIHDLLKTAQLDVDNDARLNEAARLTGQLHDLLKELQHNIDRAGSLPDTARLRAIVLDAASKLEVRGHGPARTIREQFVSFDRIFSDIAERLQLRAASTRQPSTTALELIALLKSLADADKRTFTKVTSALINLYHQPQPPAPSPQPPLSAFVPTDWPVPASSEAEIASAREAVRRQLDRPISPDRVRRLARALLDGKPQVRAADLVAAGQAGLPLLIHLRLYGDGSLGYKLEDQPWAEVNGLVFRDFVLKNLEYIPQITQEVDTETTSDIVAIATNDEVDSPPIPQ